MVRILNGCNCGTCNGGTPAPEGHFGGSACLCRCHEKPGKPLMEPCQYCNGDQLDGDHEFGCDKEPQPDVQTLPLKDGKPLSETEIIRKGWDWKESPQSKTLMLEHDSCREDVLALLETITQQAEIIDGLKQRIADRESGWPCCTIHGQPACLGCAADCSKAEEANRAFRLVLKKIQNEDYRGNRPRSASRAFEVLDQFPLSAESGRGG